MQLSLHALDILQPLLAASQCFSTDSCVNGCEMTFFVIIGAGEGIGCIHDKYHIFMHVNYTLLVPRPFIQLVCILLPEAEVGLGLGSRL